MMNDAIIGCTGFVGNNLCRQHDFSAQFHSANIESIMGQHFDTVVCAAAPGSMLMASRQPERDRAAIDALIERLDGVRARRLVLISSIAVLADFAAGDDESTQAFQTELAYGRHRHLLEAFCETRFEDCLVVRLPALFGPGLRKNFVFDLMNPVPTMMPEARFETLLGRLASGPRSILARLYVLKPETDMLWLDRSVLDADPKRRALEAAVRDTGMSAIQFHNPETTYQYYDLARLWQDICVATRAGLPHVHLTVAPLRAADIYAHLIGAPMPETGAKLHREDIRTCHAALWGRKGPYLEDTATVLGKLAVFFASRRQPE